MTRGLRIERAGAVATLTLDRAGVGNAIDRDLARGLLDATIACEIDDTVRCVVLTGAGKLFCAGGDIRAMAAAGHDAAKLVRELATLLHAAQARLLRMAKPVVTAINGPAAGAGVGLSMVGDIAIADPMATFKLAYGLIGLSPDGGATWMLPRLVGMRHAQEICLLDQSLSAGEAQKLGMVTRLSSAGDALVEALDVATYLATRSAPAIAATRRLLFDSFDRSFEAQAEAEAHTITALADGKDAREGIDAFLERRSPSFGQACE